MTANTSKILHTHVHIKNIHLSKYIKWPKEKLPMPKFIQISKSLLSYQFI